MRWMTADCTRSLPRNSSRDKPLVNRWVSCAASRMSAAMASSFHIHGLESAENVFAANPISVFFDPVAFDQIHFASQYGGEFLGHVVARPGAVSFFARKIRSGCIKEVQVTPRPEIITEDRAENLQFGNFPPPTKIGDFVQRQFDLGCQHKAFD